MFIAIPFPRAYDVSNLAWLRRRFDNGDIRVSLIHEQQQYITPPMQAAQWSQHGRPATAVRLINRAKNSINHLILRLSDFVSGSP